MTTDINRFGIRFTAVGAPGSLSRERARLESELSYMNIHFPPLSLPHSTSPLVVKLKMTIEARLKEIEKEIADIHSGCNKEAN